MGQAYIIAGVLLGVGLLGEYLLGPKGSSTKQAGPEAMPSLNSAVRGSPVYVSFGANRIDAQITWSKNFKAVRQTGSGKGGAKGGGSGGFGSAKGGGAAGQQYEYFWDMQFSYGMMDVPMTITRGWIGGDVIDDASIKAILNSAIFGGSSGNQAFFQAIINLLKSLSQTTSQNGPAKLNFTSCFFGPGYNIGDPNLTTWDYFQSQEGVACQWPSMAWVGFQGLDLGQSPAIPQLSFEFVPQSFNLITGGAFISKEDSGTPGDLQSNFNGRGLLRDDNNNLYSIDSNVGGGGSSQRAIITNIRTKTQQFLSDADIEETVYNVLGVPDTKYFYVITATSSGGLMSARLWQVNTDGTLSYTGHAPTWDYMGTRYISDNVICTGVMPNGRLLVVFFGNISTTAYTCMQSLPNPADVVSGSGETAISETQELTGLHDASDFQSCLGASGSNRTYNMQAGVISGTDIDTSMVCFYVGKAEMDYHAAHLPGDLGYVKYIGDLQPTYPTGCMIMIEVTSNGTGLACIVNGVDNSYFQNADGSPLIPFADQLQGVTGTITGDTHDDWFSPTATALVRPFSDDHHSFRTSFFLNDGTKAIFNTTVLTTLSVDDVGGLSSNNLDCINITLDSTGGVYGSLDWDNGGGNPGRVQCSIGFQTVDVTPAYVIYRILTSQVFGFQTQSLFGYSVTADRINQASYQAAVEWCVTQGIFISVSYTSADNLLDVLNELVALYNGFLTDLGGIINFGFITGSDSPIRTIDNHHLVADEGKPPVQTQKAALEDGYNRIQFNYLDRSLDYNPNQVQVDDEVDQDINTIRLKTYEARFVMSGSVAAQIANRALWQNLYGKDAYTFTVGWKDADLSQGDLITLVDSFDPMLSGGVRARILKWSNKKRGTYEVSAVREFPYIATATIPYTQTSTLDQGYGGLVQPIEPVWRQTAYELPQEFQSSKAYLYFGYQQASLIMGAQLYLSTDGANYVLAQDTQPYIISGVLNQNLNSCGRGHIERDMDFFIYPTSPFSAASPTFVQTYDLDDVTTAIRAAGGGVLMVGSEAVAIENLTLLGQNHYRARYTFRGWGGTMISPHSAGDWFHQHASGIFLHEISQTDIGNKLWYKIVPYNFGGQGADISSVDASTYTVRGGYWLPRPQWRTHIYPSSPLASFGPLNGAYVSVVSGGCDIGFGWPAASNKDGYGSQGFGANGYGHFEPDQGGLSLPDYRVEVQSVNGFTVRSTVVYTGWFNYGLLSNSADFGGVAHDYQIKVTPFNNIGDGLSQTRTLHMGW